MALKKSQWTQSFAFSKLYSNQPKSEIYPKMSMFEQLRKQVPVNSKKIFWPLIKRILKWTFWGYKSSWSKKSTPIQPWGFLGVFRPSLQRSLIYFIRNLIYLIILIFLMNLKRIFHSIVLLQLPHSLNLFFYFQYQILWWHLAKSECTIHKEFGCDVLHRRKTRNA